MYRSAQFTIRQRRPWLQRAIVLTIIGFAAGGGYALYTAGQSAGRGELLSLLAARDSIVGMNEELRAEVSAVRDELDTQTLRASLSETAKREHERLVAREQRALTALREELEFYRALAVGAEADQPLTIRNVRVARGAHRGQFAYSVVLARVGPFETSAAGELTITLHGQRGDGDIASETVATRAFEFRHYARLHGVFEVPESLTPRSFVARATAAQPDSGAVMRSFDWPAELGNGPAPAPGAG